MTKSFRASAEAPTHLSVPSVVASSAAVVAERRFRESQNCRITVLVGKDL